MAAAPVAGKGEARAQRQCRILGSTLPLPAKIAYCETLYRHHGLPALFRITPFTQPPALDRVLGEHGYATFEPTLVQAASLEARPEPDALPDGIALTETDVTTFVDVIGDLRGSTRITACRPSRASRNYPWVSACVLRADDRIVCAAQIALEDDLAGVYDVVTAEAARGNGYAKWPARRCWRGRRGTARAPRTCRSVRTTRPHSRFIASSGSRRCTRTTTAACRANMRDERRDRLRWPSRWAGRCNGTACAWPRPNRAPVG